MSLTSFSLFSTHGQLSIVAAVSSRLAFQLSGFQTLIFQFATQSIYLIWSFRCLKPFRRFSLVTEHMHIPYGGIQSPCNLIQTNPLLSSMKLLFKTVFKWHFPTSSHSFPSLMWKFLSSCPISVRPEVRVQLKCQPLQVGFSTWHSLKCSWCTHSTCSGSFHYGNHHRMPFIRVAGKLVYEFY